MWAYVYTEDSEEGKKRYIVPDAKTGTLGLGKTPYLWYTDETSHKWRSTGAKQTCWDTWEQGGKEVRLYHIFFRGSKR
jgi:hypothetical protein